LVKCNLPVIVVDDGSAENQTKKLQHTCNVHDFIYIKRDKNGGKGAAMITGLCKAEELGFSNAIQIDADGQHDINDVETFLNLAKKHPEALIMGQPVYDSSAPKSRLVGRKITNFWVAVECLNRHMPDAMCGFRVYPVKTTTKVLPYVRFLRMGFDIEILVKLYRKGVKIITTEIRVIYPKTGTSNFHIWRDNFYISLLHIYMCFGLPFWLIGKLFRKIKSLFLLPFLLCGAANAQNITQMPQTLKTFVDNLDTVYASYVQTKTLPESVKTFRAKGTVYFVKDVGFKWKQQSPNVFDFTSTLDSYCVNNSKQTLSGLPYFTQIQSMIKDVMNGDMSNFLAAFKADYTENKKTKTWTLQAIPKISAISDFLESVILSGNLKDLRQIVIVYKNGATIVIDFKRIKTGAPDEIKC
ncbi:MAG: glycosyltransferase, partial [Alphaproteobacteria bacterium]|nr:glycosyltransferase [Alphaproteobacteria bacterium]